MLSIRVDSAIRSALDAGSARIPQEVATVGRTVREYAHNALKSELSARLGNRTERLRKRYADRLEDRFDDVDDDVPVVPSGLPITPVPGYWYATANVWTVESRGEYARFAVSAPVGVADDPGAVLTYVRDGGPATLDWDGDGRDEAFGTAERVSFSVATAVVVVVPPGPEGVGDRNGKADERSSGWPAPGPVGGAGNRSDGTK